MTRGEGRGVTGERRRRVEEHVQTTHGQGQGGGACLWGGWTKWGRATGGRMGTTETIKNLIKDCVYNRFLKGVKY